MALIDTHPDYMALDGSNPQAGEYPIGLYKELLHYARSRYAGEYWPALPRQVAAYLLKSMALAQTSQGLSQMKLSLTGDQAICRSQCSEWDM